MRVKKKNRVLGRENTQVYSLSFPKKDGWRRLLGEKFANLILNSTASPHLTRNSLPLQNLRSRMRVSSKQWTLSHFSLHPLVNGLKCPSAPSSTPANTSTRCIAVLARSWPVVATVTARWAGWRQQVPRRGAEITHELSTRPPAMPLTVPATTPWCATGHLPSSASWPSSSSTSE